MRITISMMGKLREEHISPQAGDALLRVFRDWKNDLTQ